MAHLIDKDILVAEIERLDTLYHTSKSLSGDLFIQGLFCFVDTFEVKEVDLEKELNDFIEEQKAWVKDDRIVEYNNGDSFNHIYDLESVAKHFFELGLKASQNNN